MNNINNKLHFHRCENLKTWGFFWPAEWLLASREELPNKRYFV